LRPHIVWVGEAPLGIDTAMIALATCETYVSIGNAGAGEPGRSFIAEAKRAGAHTLGFAHEPTPLSPEFDDCIYGPLIETVPDWVKRTVKDKQNRY
jgi:NAD-dependent deacetylase